MDYDKKFIMVKYQEVTTVQVQENFRQNRTCCPQIQLKGKAEFFLSGKNDLEEHLCDKEIRQGYKQTTVEILWRSGKC